MKYRKTALFCALLGAAALTSATAQSPGKLPTDGYAAVVDEKIITIGDVMMSINEAQERLRLQYSGADLESRRQELFYAGLERLIDEALIIEEFNAQEGQIPDRAIDDRINAIVYENFDNDKPALLAALAKDGITLEEWRESIRERIIVSAMRRNEIGDRVVISPRDIVDTYRESQDRYEQPERVKLNLIFLRAGDDTDAALLEAQDARTRILSGESFGDVARDVSDDSSSAIGGDWGWINPTELRDDLAAALDGLGAGAISEPVFTPEGYYLLRVEERQDAFTKSLEEVRAEIELELREREAERLYKAWMERLRKKHSVLYYIPRPSDEP